MRGSLRVLRTSDLRKKIFCLLGQPSISLSYQEVQLSKSKYRNSSSHLKTRRVTSSQVHISCAILKKHSKEKFQKKRKKSLSSKNKNTATYFSLVQTSKIEI